MIRLKRLLEITDTELKPLLYKIQHKQFKFIGGGDNGRVYEINGEDKVFKITKETDEFEVAARLENNWSKFTTFIPVYYVNSKQQMYIMANANPISVEMKQKIDSFMQDYAVFARQQGGEVSIFDFMTQTDNTDPVLDNFLNALKADIDKLSVPEFDLDLDFRSDNVMMWNGKMVMVDW
jgi:hypothetical protein